MVTKLLLCTKEASLVLFQKEPGFLQKIKSKLIFIELFWKLTTVSQVYLLHRTMSGLCQKFDINIINYDDNHSTL